MNTQIGTGTKSCRLTIINRKIITAGIDNGNSITLINNITNRITELEKLLSIPLFIEKLHAARSTILIESLREVVFPFESRNSA
ncbi:MAG: hypothetical protein GY754_32605 [bacterium]|nr:hypothetical protein [bacterium]